METPSLQAKRRSSVGTKSSRAVRDAGRLPGIIYGHGETPEAITIDAHSFNLAMSHGARTMKLDVDGSSGQYLIKEIQYDYLNTRPVHVDFMRVDLEERVTVKIGIELRGVPVGVGQGGVLDQLMNDLEVECLAIAIPDTLHPLVANLDINDSLRVRDLNLPEGVNAMADDDDIVATVRMLTDEAEAEESEEGASAEPELIGRRAEEDSDEG